MEQKQQIQVLIGLGWGDRAIYRETGRDRGTIAKVRKQYEKKLKAPNDAEELSGQNQPKGSRPTSRISRFGRAARV
jgi:hypothetical protein